MKLYRMITGKDDSEFCHRVTQALNRGWHLTGSPSLAFHAERGEMMCGQAVTKEVPDRDYSPDMTLGDF